MIETLLGGLLGGAFCLAPELLKWLDRKGERGHELSMQDKALEWFRNRLEARVVIKDWMDHYNAVRPHSSLGYRTPREFVEQFTPKGNSGEARVNVAMA